MKPTGPSQETRAVVIGRSGSRCELCGGPLHVGSIHHRRPRKMGGTKADWVNAPDNLLAVCGTGITGCHGMVERERERGYECGWLLREGLWGWSTPFADLDGRWWLLDGDRKQSITLPFRNPASLVVTRGEVGWFDPFDGKDANERG